MAAAGGALGERHSANLRLRMTESVTSERRLCFCILLLPLLWGSPAHLTIRYLSLNRVCSKRRRTLQLPDWQRCDQGFHR